MRHLPCCFLKITTLISGSQQQWQRQHRREAAQSKQANILERINSEENSLGRRMDTVNTVDGVIRVQLVLMSCIGWSVRTERLHKQQTWKRNYYGIALQKSMVILGMMVMQPMKMDATQMSHPARY
jgi:hypothetical protein